MQCWRLIFFCLLLFTNKHGGGGQGGGGGGVIVVTAATVAERTKDADDGKNKNKPNTNAEEENNPPAGTAILDLSSSTTFSSYSSFRQIMMMDDDFQKLRKPKKQQRQQRQDDLYYKKNNNNIDTTTTTTTKFKSNNMKKSQDDDAIIAYLTTQEEKQKKDLEDTNDHNNHHQQFTTGRKLQSCPPFDVAIPINFDPTGDIGLGTLQIITGETTPASTTMLPSEGCVTSSPTSPTVYYTFTLTQAATIAITTCSPNTFFDTAITVWSQNTNDQGCNIACRGHNDDHQSDQPVCRPSRDHSFFSFQRAPPARYYIAVSGSNDDDFGEFELILQALEDLPTLPPAPAPFCTLDLAVFIPYNPSGMLVTGNTFGQAPTLPTLSGCIENQLGPTSWYEFTISATDFATATTLAVTTCSPDTSFDTLIAVFREIDRGGCTVECIGANDSHGLGGVELCASSQRHSALFFDVPANQRETYYVAVSGTSPIESGDFELLILTTTNLDEGLQLPETPAPVPAPIPTPAPTPSPVNDVVTPAPQEEDCNELYQGCDSNEDCCDGGICVTRTLVPTKIKICSSQYVRARAKNTIGDGDRGGQAGRAKAGGS